MELQDYLKSTNLNDQEIINALKRHLEVKEFFSQSSSDLEKASFNYSQKFIGSDDKESEFNAQAALLGFTAGFGFRNSISNLNGELIFVSSPYTGKSGIAYVDEKFTNDRYTEAMKYTAHLMDQGLNIVSLIVSYHQVASLMKKSATWENWDEFCKLMISKCTKLIVLQLEGWENSTGIAGEVDFANKLGLIVEYVNYEEWLKSLNN